MPLNQMQSYKMFMKDTLFPDNYFIKSNMFYNILSYQKYSLFRNGILKSFDAAKIKTHYAGWRQSG